jgi:hypothetical protein
VEDEPDAKCLKQKAELPAYGGSAFLLAKGGLMKKICFVFVLCGLVSCFVPNAYSDTPYILVNIDAPGAVETVAFDINNHGKIVGYYQDSSG